MQTWTLDQYRAAVGTQIGLSPWRTVPQATIDAFADATDDHQFIHVDPERAAATPFGGTVAHGFLTLSLLSPLAAEALPRLEGAEMGVNHGFEAVRFVSPVRSGARIRGRFTLVDMKVRPSGWIQLTTDAVVEIEGLAKPALTARWLTLPYVNPDRGG